MPEAPKYDLLKEALADAELIKKAALENARRMIEEEFQPQIASLLSTRLRNEAESVAEQTTLDSSEINGSGVTVDEPAAKQPSKAASDSSDITNPKQEVDTLGEGFDDFGGEEEEEDDVGAAPAPAAAAAAPAAPAAPAPAPAPAMDAGAVPSDAPAVDGMGGDEDLLDLEALIRELELDVGDTTSITPEAPRMEAFKHANAGVDAHAGLQVESTDGANDKDGPDMPAVDGVNGGKKVTAGQQVTGSKEGITEDFNLDEILKELAEEETVSEVEALREEVTALKSSLKEHRDAVSVLHERIKEVNMLNAKLMYTNKLFRGFNLSESQKHTVVDTFERAASLREVKLVYTTLAESFIGKTGTAAKRVSKPLTEGMASRSGGSTAPKNPQVANSQTEISDTARRLQKLAGIKIS